MAFEQQMGKKGFIFGLDNVIYPERDYLLQVYYLFSEFMAYTEQIDAKEVITFMQAEFEAYGSAKIFDKTAAKFNIPLKYAENFALLHQNARLPLKLVLYPAVLNFLQEAIVNKKEIFLLVDGDPQQQLNKIKQLEWQGVEKALKVYFSAEFEAKPSAESIAYLLENNNLQKEEVLLIGANSFDEIYAENVGVAYLSIEEILV